MPEHQLPTPNRNIEILPWPPLLLTMYGALAMMKNFII